MLSQRIPLSHFLISGGEKCNEHTSGKNRKKVRFNLNVKIYQPNLTEYQILDNEKEKSGNTYGEAEGSAALTMTYPSNYRYYNYKEDCDDEDDITYEESDSDTDNGNNNDEFDDGDGSGENKEFEACDQNTRQKELLKLYSLVAEERIKNQLPLAPTEAYLKSYLRAQNRSMCMPSVMCPVENLTQWKAIKAKVTSSNKQRRKDIVPPEQKKSTPLASETSFDFSSFTSDSEVHHSNSKPLFARSCS